MNVAVALNGEELGFSNSVFLSPKESILCYNSAQARPSFFAVIRDRFWS
jgi:hypothetical protein